MRGERRIDRVSCDRWDLIVALIAPDTDSVLDVGCRGRELRDYLPPNASYVGMDLVEPADVIASAEESLPFEDASFDSVVFADVLEHLNDPHGALDEAMRVARKSIVILLPNLFTLFFRLHYLARGRMPSEKYAFDAHRKLDRHRWLMNFEQAAAFTHGRAELTNWNVAREFAYNRPFRRRLARVGYWTARRIGGPNLWAWEYAARLEPSKSAPARLSDAERNHPVT
jgi:SAM-dependent methyltransferase